VRERGTKDNLERMTFMVVIWYRKAGGKKGKGDASEVGFCTGRRGGEGEMGGGTCVDL